MRSENKSVPALIRYRIDGRVIREILIHYRVDGRVIWITMIRIFLLRYCVDVVLGYLTIQAFFMREDLLL